MSIHHQHSLQNYNTFGIDAKAEYFVSVNTIAELQTALTQPIHPKFILGGGSNMLLTGDVSGLVIQNNLKQKILVREYAQTVHVAAAGGENWQEFVQWCLDRNYGGVENLSLIPGTVGAAPIQNIGAYGVELKDVFLRLEAIEIKTGKKQIFKASDCAFGYRDSVFKRKLKGKYCITKVYFRLSKNPKVHIDYGDIRNTLAAQNIDKPNIQDVSKAVIHIRQSKLPDPAVLGNSGSFFKNPEIGQKQFKSLHQQYPAMPHYPLGSGKVKIPAGWLIEQCGWKGKRVGRTGSHAQQALVLVNYGGASGKELWALAQKIIVSVQERFGIVLVPEVNVL